MTLIPRLLTLALCLLSLTATTTTYAHNWNTESRRISSRPMYLSVGAGALTYIGNEDIADARHNSITPNLYVEWGYSLTPEIALALNLNLFMAQSQSRYRLNPYIDFTQETANDDGYWPYQSFHFYGGILTGVLVLDWTNIIAGGDRNAKLRISTPIGMGITITSGSKKNPWTDYSPVNKEFSMMVGFSFDYRISDNIALSCSPRLNILRGSLDYSPYSNNESSPIDIMPMITIGARFTLNARLPWISR